MSWAGAMGLSRCWKRGVVRVALSLGILALTALVAYPVGATTTAVNWGKYLNGLSHTSYQPGATAISPSTAGTLVQAWSFLPSKPPIASLKSGFDSSPTVVGKVIYIGSTNGTFYALNETTGQIVWSRFIGYQPSLTTGCGSHGFVSTATVETSPSTGKLTVYVAAPDGYLYALSAKTGATIWRSVIAVPSSTVNDYFDWSSPTVVDGRIYVGISSHCDDPLVRAGLLSFDQGSGAPLASFYTVPSGDVGASIWSSVAVGPNGTVYATTGNGPANDPSLGYSISILALNGLTLEPISSWQVPVSQQPGVDSDFGGSPTLFSALLPGRLQPTQMVGACNKNGTYYAWRRADLAAGPLWQYSIGSQTDFQCIAAAWDGSHLFIGGYDGQVAELDPATGTVVWTTTVPGAVLGSPALDGGGVLAVPTYGTSAPGVVLLNAATGATLATLATQVGSATLDSDFAQPVFADGYVFTASAANGMVAYQLPDQTRPGGGGGPGRRIGRQSFNRT